MSVFFFFFLLQGSSYFILFKKQNKKRNTIFYYKYDCDVCIFVLYANEKIKYFLLQFHDGSLFLYGGIYEDGDRQFTYSDFYSLDVNKMDKWTVIVKDDKSRQVWQESDSSDDEEGAKGGKKPSGKGKKTEVDGEDDSDGGM